MCVCARVPFVYAPSVNVCVCVCCLCVCVVCVDLRSCLQDPGFTFTIFSSFFAGRLLRSTYSALYPLPLLVSRARGFRVNPIVCVCVRVCACACVCVTLGSVPYACVLVSPLCMNRL